jgi:hypothetical protein
LGILRYKLSRQHRDIIARQLAVHLKPGFVGYALMTRKGRVIGVYPEAQTALDLLNGFRTVYKVTAEPWYHGKTRVHLSYQLS